MAEIPTLQTCGLILRPLQAPDAVTLQRIYQAEGVLRYFPNSAVPPLEKVERFIANQQAHWERHGYGNWGVVPHEASGSANQIAGWAGLQYLPELDETEVGFLLDRSQWGKGFATEAALASLRFGFENFELSHIIALVHPENRVSQHVIEKCGMTYVDSLALWGMELMRYRANKKAFDRIWIQEKCDGD
jgi:ribosomal-protein-alanine N-acetyltransferase